MQGVSRTVFAYRLLRKMLVVPLLLLVARPTNCFTSSSVDARAAVRAYSVKKDPHGRLRHAIATGNVIRLDETECDETHTPLAVYVDDKGREPSLLDPALFAGLVKGGRLLYTKKRWCFETRNHGSSAKNGSLGCYSDRSGNTVLIPLGGKVRGSVFVRSCYIKDNRVITRLSGVPGIPYDIAECPWRKYPVGSAVIAKCDPPTKSGLFICDENLQWSAKVCDEEPWSVRRLPHWNVTTMVPTIAEKWSVWRIGKFIGAAVGCVCLAFAMYSGRRRMCRRSPTDVPKPYAIPMKAP